MSAAKKTSITDLLLENEELRVRMIEAEETLRAIREGDVDAVVVSGTKGEQIFSLVRTDSMYRLIVETMKEAAFTVTFDGTILFCNAQFAQFVKRPLEHIIGHPLKDFVVANQHAAVDALLLISRKQSMKQRLELLGSDGAIVTTHISANVLNQPDGLSICVVATDLTDLENSTVLIQQLRRQKEVLEESEIQLKSAQEIAHLGSWVLDLVNKQLTWSDEVYRIFGLQPQEFGATYEAFLDITHPDDRAAVDAAYSGSLREGKDSYEIEHRIVRQSSGEIRFVHEKCVHSRDESGRIIRSIGMVHDVTERKQMEKIQTFLAQTGSGTNDEPFFDSLARHLAEALDMNFVCIDRLEGDGLNARTVVMWCDGKFEDNVTYALKDTPCGDVVGKTVCCFPAGVCQYFPRDEVLKDLRAESYVGVTLWGYTGKPTGLIAVIGRTPLKNRSLAESVLKMVAGRAACELERQAAEQALQQAHNALGIKVEERTKELRESNQRLLAEIEERRRNEMELALQRSALAHLSRVAMLGELSGSIAHELNQPLAAILSNAQAAQRFLAVDVVDLQELREILKDIVEDDQRAGEIIRRLRNLFKKGEADHQHVDVNSLVMDAVRVVGSDLANNNILLHTELASDLPVVQGDRVQLLQVLTNLVLNASDALDHLVSQNRRITILSARTKDAGVQVTVMDRGSGIAPDQIEKIFEPFFTTKQHGLGLGLSICRTIITSHGGKLWAANNADGGATFHFTLPPVKQSSVIGEQ